MMKKTGVVCGMIVAGMIGVGTYILMNKQTKSKADRLINNLLDKANTITNNMMD